MAAVEPLATNPPVTIGPFNNVPAPGSGVKSDWAQSISQYVTDHVAELMFVQMTANLSVPPSGNEATAVAIFSPPNVTYDGKPVLIEFFAYGATIPAGVGTTLVLNLWDANTNLGFWGQVINNAAAALTVPLHLVRRLTPTAGVHNYNVRAFTPNATAATIFASPGGAAGTPVPAFLRVARV
jgi:hypothetical protein